jgi:hypothetical protein
LTQEDTAQSVSGWAAFQLDEGQLVLDVTERVDVNVQHSENLERRQKIDSPMLRN